VWIRARIVRDVAQCAGATKHSLRRASRAHTRDVVCCARYHAHSLLRFLKPPLDGWIAIVDTDLYRVLTSVHGLATGRAIAHLERGGSRCRRRAPHVIDRLVDATGDTNDPPSQGSDATVI
jgi:hypothetical protein